MIRVRALLAGALLVAALTVWACGGGDDGPVVDPLAGVPLETPVVELVEEPADTGDGAAPTAVAEVLPTDEPEVMAEPTEAPSVVATLEPGVSVLGPTPESTVRAAKERRSIAEARAAVSEMEGEAYAQAREQLDASKPAVMPAAVPASGSAGSANADSANMLNAMPQSSPAAGFSQHGRGGLPPEAGGKKNPNEKRLPLMYFQGYGVNPFVDADEDNLSTFALDGDTASYELGKSYLERGWLPEADSVRVEEWVNAFEQGYASPESGLSLMVDGGESRFGEEGYKLMRVGVSSAVPQGERDPVSLVFVVDVSGSMESDGRLGLAKSMMLVLLDMLVGSDRAALVTYGSEASVEHEFAAGDDTETLEAKIGGLLPGGSTYVEEGIRVAYGLAKEEIAAGRKVRLVLFSDGVGNVGETGAEGILALIDEEAKKDATLTAVGVGLSGNYNDVMLEVLANRGNGTYHYVAGEDAAERFIEENAESVFREVARDARVQVEFNGDAVRKYRLIGYENRAVADEDFSDDTLDFGEPGFSRDVTALYEVRLEEGVDDDAELATVRLRWKDVASDGYLQVEETIEVGDVGRGWDKMGPFLRRSAVVAEFAELLRKSYWAQCGDIPSVVEALEGVATEDQKEDELSLLLEAAAGEFEPYCKL